MATPITRKSFLDLVRPAINKMFDEVYADFNPELYIKEVDFGHDKPERTRRSTQTVHPAPSGSNGSD